MRLLLFQIFVANKVVDETEAESRAKWYAEHEIPSYIWTPNMENEQEQAHENDKHTEMETENKQGRNTKHTTDTTTSSTRKRPSRKTHKFRIQQHEAQHTNAYNTPRIPHTMQIIQLHTSKLVANTCANVGLRVFIVLLICCM